MANMKGTNVIYWHTEASWCHFSSRLQGHAVRALPDPVRAVLLGKWPPQRSRCGCSTWREWDERRLWPRSSFPVFFLPPPAMGSVSPDVWGKRRAQGLQDQEWVILQDRAREGDEREEEEQRVDTVVTEIERVPSTNSLASPSCSNCLVGYSNLCGHWLLYSLAGCYSSTSGKKR